MKNRFNIKEYLGTKELYGKMLRYGVPISAQSLIAVGMNMIDTVMLSHMGDAQISAASLAGQYTTLFLICAMGLGMGASVLTTRYWGMHDLSDLKKAVTIMLRWELILAGIFTVIGLFFPAKIMNIFTREQRIIQYGAVYLNWMLPIYFCMAISQGCIIVLRSAGLLSVPLWISAAALGVNVGFNWVLINGNLGAPRMEIAGAALATTIAWLFELVLVFMYFGAGEQCGIYGYGAHGTDFRGSQLRDYGGAAVEYGSASRNRRSQRYHYRTHHGRGGL